MKQQDRNIEQQYKNFSEFREHFKDLLEEMLFRLDIAPLDAKLSEPDQNTQNAKNSINTKTTQKYIISSIVAGTVILATVAGFLVYRAKSQKSIKI